MGKGERWYWDGVDLATYAVPVEPLPWQQWWANIVNDEPSLRENHGITTRA